MEITFDDFKKVQIKLGTVLSVSINEKARKPSLVLKVDFGKEIGIKESSAQITHYYTKENLIGKQVIGVCNFPEKNIAGVISEVLILGAIEKDGKVVLVHPSQKAENGLDIAWMYPDLISLMMFGFVTAMTPGPNNIASSYSGFNFGYKKTLPLIFAVIFGWTLLLIVMNTGLILIFRQYPIIQEVIRILGSIFLVYLAYLISFSKPSKATPIKNPITFGKAFALQFINPKSLVVSMTTVSIFIDPTNYLRDSIIVISFFFLMAVVSVNSWCLIGMYLRNFATSEKFIRNFNYSMSFLLIVCVIMFYV